MILMLTDVIITQLPDSSDDRGMSFSLPTGTIADLSIRDVHIAAIRPGHVRGNHYHTKKIELITVVYNDEWSLHWDTGVGTPITSRKFNGSGAISIFFPLLWSHAVRNDGAKDIWLFNVTDLAFDPSLPGTELDSLPRRVA
jgi:dTDP-4-dehydrorhamnose 3,5-epimerase-like enzyme